MRPNGDRASLRAEDGDRKEESRGQEIRKEEGKGGEEESDEIVWRKRPPSSCRTGRSCIYILVTSSRLPNRNSSLNYSKQRGGLRHIDASRPTESAEPAPIDNRRASWPTLDLGSMPEDLPCE